MFGGVLGAAIQLMRPMRGARSWRAFRCTHCGFTADRDEKAAMCLAVKYLRASW